MNLFLLAAVPLAAVILHRLFFASKPAFAEPQSWIAGSVWSVLALVVSAPFGKLREFDGSPATALAGLFLTDALLVPGLVVAAWVLTRPRRDAWELGLWLALVFTMAGLRDFVATSRTFDLTEFFLVPFDRILLVVGLPLAVAAALTASVLSWRLLFWLLVAGLILTGPAFQVLSFGGWGWLVWILEAAGLATALWAQKKAAPRGSGPEDQTGSP